MTESWTILLLVEMATLRLRVALLEGKSQEDAIEDARALMMKWLGTISHPREGNEDQRVEFQRLFDMAVQNALEERHRSGPV